MNVANERSPLLAEQDPGQHERLISHTNSANNALEQFISENEQKLSETYVGERLPYSDYSSIDFLHYLVGAFTCHHFRCSSDTPHRPKTLPAFAPSADGLACGPSL